MKVSEFSVKHPIVISMFLIVLVAFGIFSVTKMPTEFMVDITMPQAIVYTIYPGASAEDVEEDVTKILEDNFVTVPHFKAIESQSFNSISWITITYADGYDAYDQLEELRNRINLLKPDLPEGLQSDPVAIVGGMSMLPVISFTVEAGQDSGRITEFIKDELTPMLTQIDGVSSIEIDGGKELEVEIKINVDSLTSRGISVAAIYQVLNYGNVTLPLGNGEFENRSIQLRYSGSFSSLDDIRNLPVGLADKNNIIRLGDVAQVSLAYPKDDYEVTDGINPIVLVGITKRNDGDTVKICKQVKKALEECSQTSGGAIQFHIISDDSRQVKASLKTVITSGVMGVIFAVLVILLFMADWRATLTISLSIPLCILFSLIGLKLCGISLNLMSLSGLVISLGMVVDGSTVMLDQIYRYYKRRDPATGLTEFTVNQAIYKGWDEVSSSILASCTTTIVVFLPIALLTGLIGKILHAVAITIIMAIVASFIVAIVIVPYLLKLLLKEEGPAIRKKERKFDKVMKKIENGYRRILKWAIRNRIAVIITAVLLLIFSAFTAILLGVAFIPSTDTGEFYISMDFPIGTKFEQTKYKMQIAQDLLYQYVPEVESVIFYTGQSNTKGILPQAVPESGYARVILKPVSERKRDVHDIMKQVQEVWTAVIPDAKVSVQNGGFDKLVGYVSGGGGYGLTLISEDLNTLYDTATKLKEFLETDPDVVTAKLDTDFDTSTMVIDMSQEYLSSLGITSYEAGITSAILFQGVDTGRFKDEKTGQRYKVHLCSDITDGNVSPDTISNVHIVTQNGMDVSFANLSDIRVEKSISQINHSDRAKTITVSATLVSENTAGVSSRVREYLANNPLPNGVSSKSGGIMALIGDMVTPMVTAIIIAIFLVYTVMVLQFERFRQPLLILVTIPFCFIGVVLGLLIFGSTLNLLSLLGLISLSGVVVNNGIILVDYVNQLRKQRREEIAKEKGSQNRDGDWIVELSPEEEDQLLEDCVADGSASRIQPILITTLTTLLGDIPMAVARGEGAELYAPMGQAIVGGLITSTLITLILIPVLYYTTERKSKEMKMPDKKIFKKLKLKNKFSKTNIS
ncbi:MAG: efflux RND transporter permease subunit [Treponemataceae bacterium]|nr:efflux RND transporter permease subunit [Treponemataceae bacterium]